MTQEKQDSIAINADLPTLLRSKAQIKIFVNIDNIPPSRYANIDNLYVTNTILEAEEIRQFFMNNNIN